MGNLSPADILNLIYDPSAEAIKNILVNSSGTIIKSVLLEEIRSGSDCSGSHGTPGRVLTLQNTSESGSPVAVWVENQLISLSDFSINHLSSNSTITFGIDIFDADEIKVHYYI